jgi:hypothetical protein
MAPHRSSGWSLDIIRTTRALSISLGSITESKAKPFSLSSLILNYFQMAQNITVIPALFDL